MTTGVRELPGLESGPIQPANFGPPVPTIDTFAREHRLKLSRVFDGDPFNPHACYFLSRGGPKDWRSGWICVCALDPFCAGRALRIARYGWNGERPHGSHHSRVWEYSGTEGTGGLRALLAEAEAWAQEQIESS